jgi:hypothetical protein
MLGEALVAPRATFWLLLPEFSGALFRAGLVWLLPQASLVRGGADEIQAGSR